MEGGEKRERERERERERARRAREDVVFPANKIRMIFKRGGVVPAPPRLLS